MARPRLGIEISTDYNSAGFKAADADAKTFGITVDKVAAKNIERTLQQKVRLEELASEYKRVAATYKAGSVEQVAALDLVAKAERRLGVATHERALAEREIGRFARGGIEATGGLGRTGLGLALGSGGFLAGAATVGALKVAIDARRELMDAEEQLGVAVDNTGHSWERSREHITEWVKTASAASLFTRAQITANLVGLVRATGSVTKAQHDETLAENIARGAHIDLATATQDLINLEGGRTRGLVTLGVKIPVVKTAQDALRASGLLFTGQQKAEAAALDRQATAMEGKRKLLEKYAGSSKAFSESDASSSDRLKKSVNDLATATGSELLPALKKVEDPLAHFIEQLATGKGSGMASDIHSLATELQGLSDILNTVTKPFGGFLNVVRFGLNHTAPIQLLKQLHDANTLFTGDKKGVALPANMGLNGGATSPVGSLANLVGLSAAQKKSYIAAQARALGLDPRAVLGVATAEGGFSGAVGDGGHAYGPFQLNNAGGVITGKFPGQNSAAAQAFANSQAGIDFALKSMAKVAGGLRGMAAINAIVSGFERPANSQHDLSAASAYYFGSGGPKELAAILAAGTKKPLKEHVATGCTLLPLPNLPKKAAKKTELVPA